MCTSVYKTIFYFDNLKGSDVLVPKTTTVRIRQSGFRNSSIRILGEYSICQYDYNY